ncbi:MAG: ABC transporter ATP-binding protein [Acidobacteriota bacterium]
MNNAMPRQASLIQTHDLSKHFGTLVAVDRLNLEVDHGQIFGLVGPDGAGKTTTLRLLTGLIAPTAGDARVIDSHLSDSSFETVRERLGYMPQKPGLYRDLGVEENLLFYSQLFGLPDKVRDERMVRLLDMTHMEPFRRRRAGQLSGGMQQKLSLMCALLHQPEILFLDEPTTGVDPVSRRDFWKILYRLVRDGLTVLVTTSYLDEAERCHRVGLMHRGRLILCDAPEALANHLQEVCYRVECPNPRAARAVFNSSSGVLSVEPSGKSLHLFLSPALTSAARLEERLDEVGLGPSRWTPLNPGLEDVFIALIRKQSGQTS